MAMKTGIAPDFPFVLDVNDTAQEWFKSQIDNPESGWLAKRLAAWRLSQLKNFVPDLYRQFRHCWVIKPRDVQIPGLAHAVWLGMPYCQPEGGLPPLAPSDPASRVVIMLGSYYHRPNAEGLDWFVRKVWPRVRAEVPDAEFRARFHRLAERVGGNLGEVRRHWREDGELRRLVRWAASSGDGRLKRIALTIVAAIYLCVTYPLSKLVDKFGKKMSNPNSYRNRKVKAGGKV